ncbi:MAG: L-erythro-3,5-diaminohexanoate dehydrogenase [Bacillota bacterium]|nr:L-erythro-3,5-diaminohexanoate dehydrogenase [Bacillota bacterium]
MRKGCPYGTHRVIEPKGLLPQPAWKIDNDMEIYDNEVLIDVEVLNIDSASFTQIEEKAGGNEEKIAAKMMSIVSERGKHHNPVTGSGGMLIGKVEKIGPAWKGKSPLKSGQRLATLVSLSLTPLRIDKIKKIHKNIDQVEIEGKAILFDSGIYAVLPDDLPQTLSLAVLDVAGAAAQTAKLVRPGDKVVIIGAGGKSGMLCLHEARKRAGVTGKVIGIAPREASKQRAESTGYCDAVLIADASDALGVMYKVEEATGGELADVTINCVNIPNTELSSILATRDGGVVYYFSMATNFTAAALGAEGVGKDVTMIVGNGYTRDHAEISLNIMRESSVLRKIFEELYT